jgi:hypothetical protein
MHAFAYAALLVLPNEVQSGLPQAPNHHFLLKFVLCLIAAIVLGSLWKALEKNGGVAGFGLAWMPFVGCLGFIGLAVYNLICLATAGQPNSGPPSG